MCPVRLCGISFRPKKLTESYFRRLCYNVGVSQRLRAGMYRRYPKTLLFEEPEMGRDAAAVAYDAAPQVALADPDAL